MTHLGTFATVAAAVALCMWFPTAAALSLEDELAQTGLSVRQAQSSKTEFTNHHPRTYASRGVPCDDTQKASGCCSPLNDNPDLSWATSAIPPWLGTWSHGSNYIRFDFTDDVKCGGRASDWVQIGTAEINLTNIPATDLSVSVSGVAEAEFESLQFLVDGNEEINIVPRNGHAGSSCRRDTCVMCDVVEPATHIHLSAGDHRLKVIVSTNDPHYHVGAYYSVHFALRSGTCNECTCRAPCTDSDIAAWTVAAKANTTVQGCDDGAPLLCDDPRWGSAYREVCPEACNQCGDQDCQRFENLLPFIEIESTGPRGQTIVSPSSCDDSQFFPDLCNDTSWGPIAGAACPDVCQGVCRPPPTPSPTTGNNDRPSPSPGGPGGPPSATGDPHMINALGESYDIKQPGQYSLLRVPRQGPPALSMNGTIHSVGNPCSLFVTEANLTGVLFGGDLVRVRSGRHDEFHGKVEPFSLQVAEGEAWVSLSSVPAGQEVVLRRHRISGVSVTISAQRETSEHDVQGFFMIAIAVPRSNEHAQIKISRRYQSARAEWMNIQVARLGQFGWSDSIGGALGTDAPLKKWMEPTEACTQLRSNADHRAILLQIASEEARSVARANF